MALETYTMPGGQKVTFQVIASKGYHVNQTLNLATYIHELPLYLEVLAPGTVVNREYGKKNITVSVWLTDMWNNNVTQGAEVWWRFSSDHSINGSFTHVGDGIYNASIGTLYKPHIYTVEIRASKPNCQNATIYIHYTIVTGPSALWSYVKDNETSIQFFIGDSFTITVKFTTGGENPEPIVDANVTFYSTHPLIKSGKMEHQKGGIYSVTFNDTSGFDPGPYSITITASHFAVSTRSLVFTVTAMQPVATFKLISKTFIEVEYLEKFNVSVYLYDEAHKRNVTDVVITADWWSSPVNLVYVGNDTYYRVFNANMTAGSIYYLTLRYLGTMYNIEPLSIPVKITERATAPISLSDVYACDGDYPDPEDAEWYIRLDVNETLEVPIGDWIYLYFEYRDNRTLELIGDGTGTVVIHGVPTEPPVYDVISGYYLVKINTTEWGLGPHTVTVTIGKPNYMSQRESYSFTVIKIPTRLQLVNFQGNVSSAETVVIYIGQPFELRVNLSDTWHGWPLEGFNITVPSGLIHLEWEELGNGIYVIRGVKNTMGEIVVPLVISTEETDIYEAAVLEPTLMLEFRYSPTFIMMTWAGTAAAILAVSALSV